MRITLVVPGLLGIATELLARDRALASVAALADARSVVDLDGALLDEMGFDAAPAPVAALGAGVDVGDAWVVRADPIALEVGRDDVRLASVVLDLADDERAALLTLLRAHFSADGLAFVAPRADAWFALSATSYEFRSTPPETIGNRALRDCLPAGQHAGRWRRWLTETQMLLHDHPLASRSGQPVNGVWFSGGGGLPRSRAIPAFDALAAEGRAGDLLRGMAAMSRRSARPIVPLREAIDACTSDRIALALPPLRSAAELELVTRDFVAQALDALRRGHASAFRLIASGNGRAASWSIERPGWIARVLPRHGVFTAP